MIIVPVVDDNPSQMVMSDLYGNAAYFAFIDGEDVSIKPNTAKGDGRDTAQFVIDNKATVTFQTHMGQGLFEKLDDANVEVYLVEQKNLPLNEVLTMFKNKTLIHITSDNAKTMLDAGGTGSCQCGCE